MDRDGNALNVPSRTQSLRSFPMSLYRRLFLAVCTVAVSAASASAAEAGIMEGIVDRVIATAIHDITHGRLPPRQPTTTTTTNRYAGRRPVYRTYCAPNYAPNRAR